MSAQEGAEAIGVSRATAQRYLADLANAGRVDLTLRYGPAGRRLEHRYRWPEPDSDAQRPGTSR